VLCPVGGGAGWGVWAGRVRVGGGGGGGVHDVIGIYSSIFLDERRKHKENSPTPPNFESSMSQIKITGTYPSKHTTAHKNTETEQQDAAADKAIANY